MSLNGGLGAVTEKNQVLLEDSLSVGKITAVRHANGRDWWVLMPQADRYLYRKLRRHPELVLGGTAIDTFLTEKSTETVGQFHAIETAIQNLFTISPTDSASLSDNITAFSGKMQAIALIDSLLLSAAGQDSLQLLQQRLAAAQVIDSIGLEQDTLLADIQAQRTSASAQVISDNAAITATEVFEQNEQDVNDICLKTVVQGIFVFDSLQVASLEGIAFQCPLTGGSAVFRARGLLALVCEYEYDDENVCDSLVQRSADSSKMPEQPKTESLTLYPNPTSGTVQVGFPSPPTSGKFVVLDIHGKVVMGQQFPKGTQFTFDTQQLPVGTYICKIHFDDREPVSVKLAVFH